MRAGSYLPTQRGTSSASLRTAVPDRRPHTAPDLLPVAYPRSPEHDEVQPSNDLGTAVGRVAPGEHGRGIICMARPTPPAGARSLLIQLNSADYSCADYADY